MPVIFGIDNTEILDYCVDVLHGSGKNIIVVLSSSTRNFLFVITCSVMLEPIFGIDGVAMGFALAQVITFILCALLMCLIYGRENFPFYLESRNDIADCNLLLTPESVMNVHDKAEKFMISHSLTSQKLISHIMLLIEEIGLMII